MLKQAVGSPSRRLQLRLVSARELADVVKLVNEDGKVRLVLKELPIFSDDSEQVLNLRSPLTSRANISKCNRSCCQKNTARPTRRRLRKLPKSLGLTSISSKKMQKTPT